MIKKKIRKKNESVDDILLISVLFFHLSLTFQAYTILNNSKSNRLFKK